MYVRPAARGHGVGAAILRSLEGEAGRLGAVRVRLETGPRQPEAIALYERAGYRRVPCFGPYAEVEDSLCYERSLPGSG
jgi:GNAT superfamily N-acetyltransferase